MQKFAKIDKKLKKIIYLKKYQQKIDSNKIKRFFETKKYITHFNDHQSRTQGY